MLVVKITEACFHSAQFYKFLNMHEAEEEDFHGSIFSDLHNRQIWTGIGSAYM